MRVGRLGSRDGGSRGRRGAAGGRHLPWVLRLLILLGLLAIWQALVSLKILDALYVSSPVGIGVALGRLSRSSDAILAAEETALAVLFAFVIAAVAGVLVGVALGLNKSLQRAYLGPIVYMMSTPKILFLPLFLFAFGLGQTFAVAFGAFQGFFYVVVNVVSGLDLVEARYYRLGRAFGASRFRMFVDIIAPAALPGLFAALWHGLNLALGGVLIAELWSPSVGIGRLIRDFSNTLDTDDALTLALCVAVAAILAGTLWTYAEKSMRRWERG